MSRTTTKNQKIVKKGDGTDTATPAPKRKRATGNRRISGARTNNGEHPFTKLSEASFLRAYARLGTIRNAARVIGFTRRCLVDALNSRPDFRLAFEDAKQEFIERMEDESIRRAVKGINRGIYYQGVRVAVEKEFSDSLMQFLLKGNAPHKYRERIDQRVTGAVMHSSSFASIVREALTDNERTDDGVKKVDDVEQPSDSP